MVRKNNSGERMTQIEKSGYFYLGKEVDPSTGKRTEKPLLYESKNLTTHAVCVGMTGSGKTGLGIALIEEGAIAKIPAIIIDPKGDLTNLLLTFPDLSAEEFFAWVDPAEAERKGLTLEQYAEQVSQTWKEGLKSWGEDGERIKRLRSSVEMDIYTPASQAGKQISILGSFTAPSKEVLLDNDAMRERILSTTSSLLGLLGIYADPVKSREHILISTILSQAWANGVDLNIARLIQQVQTPPFDKVGTLDVDTFYPPKDRMALSISLNNLLASPGFQAWMEGEPLDIQQLLYSKGGKPKLSILTIAHLSDSERMFFVTLLLNEFISWMRQQPGTSNLRVLLYMDEIFGFFPPSAMPPSKMPMLTLLKQARAYGVGVVLATQNPVDLDYKGLSNCGTWFIGKLQTERDKGRVLDGLRLASNGEMDAASMDQLIAAVGKRIFIMRSIYEKNPILFETRWTLSYLRGPLTLTQIQSLTNKSPDEQAITKKEKLQDSLHKPLVPIGVTEYFLNNRDKPSSASYVPQLLGIAKLHFVDAKNKIDRWEEVYKLVPFDSDEKNVRWDEAQTLEDGKATFSKEALEGYSFKDFPSGWLQEKKFQEFQKGFAASLYQKETYTLYEVPDLGLKSKEGETEAAFRERITQAIRDKRDELAKKVKDKYEGKLAALAEKIRKSEEKVSQKQKKSMLQKFETWISIGATLLGALFGRKITKGTINSAGTSLKRAGRLTKESQDVQLAEEDLGALKEQLDNLKGEMNSEIEKIESLGDEKSIQLSSFVVRPRKSDIEVENVAIVWVLTM